MTNETAAAARLARIAHNYRNNPSALKAFMREEREILSGLNGYAFFNGGPSQSLKEQIAAFRDFCKEHGAVWESLA